jgi:selenocysteine lyase/cysteine desulfurase
MRKIEEFRKSICGIDTEVPLLDGIRKRHIFFDNAASTPSLIEVKQAINQFLDWYSAVHRGSGFKSTISTRAYDDAHEIIGKFVGADLNKNTVVLIKNTTEAVNKISNRIKLEKDDIIISSFMEHHSNDLPYRKKSKVVYVNVKEDGSIDEEDLINKLKVYRKKVKLLSLTGASNITGIVNPIHRFARLAHSYGTKILIDAAQLAPHKKIDIKPDDDPEHIDFLVFSAHKMYSPFGIGVLIAPKEIFEEGSPDYVGGGTVRIVTHDKVVWADLPDKEEAGSPNVVGAIALAKAIQVLEDFGLENLDEYEKKITKYTLENLNKIKNIHILGPADPDDVSNRLGVICFNIDGFPDPLVASILSAEGGIGVRYGCFCAHPYIKKLLNVSEEESDILIEKIINNDRSDLPGAVRISFGAYNTIEEIDEFFRILQVIIEKKFKGKYILDKVKGSYHPEGYEFNFGEYFKL